MPNTLPVRMQAWHETWAREAFRVLRPGGHLLAFSGTRTSHRMVCAIEDAGFEIRDSIVWLYGSGFPKSLDVSKAIDKRRNDDVRPVCRFLRAAIEAHPHETMRTLAARFECDSRLVRHWAASEIDTQPSVPTWEQWGYLKYLLGFGDEMDAEVWRLNGRKGRPGEAWYEREVVGEGQSGIGTAFDHENGTWSQGTSETFDITAPATDAARAWDGWGTALKPAHEPIVVARKPLVSTVAANVLQHGTGAINVDGCRIEGTPHAGGRHGVTIYGSDGKYEPGPNVPGNPAGRWPTNVILSHHEDCAPVGTRRVSGNNQAALPRNPAKDDSFFGGTQGGLKIQRSPGYAGPDGTEMVEAWACFSPSVWRDAVAHAPTLTALLGYPGGCLSCLRFCDGRVRSALAVAQAGAPSLHDALAAVGSELRQLAHTLPSRYESGRCSSDDSGLCSTDGNTLESRTFPLLDGQTFADKQGTSSAGADGLLIRSNRASNNGATEGHETPLHSECIAGSVGLLDRACTCLASGSPLQPSIPEYCAVAMLDAQSGERRSGKAPASGHKRRETMHDTTSGWGMRHDEDAGALYGDTGGASRFFYTAKASRAERNAGIPDGMTNSHPTVKSVSVMRWLVRLVTPPGGLVLDPFLGSGTTGIAAILEGFRFVGIEQDAHYLRDIATHRIAHWQRYGEDGLKYAKRRDPVQECKQFVAVINDAAQRAQEAGVDIERASWATLGLFAEASD
jgi:hypothetical protein